jgi:hypothetical protein
MSIKSWLFLVSRNRYLDYRTVVAPKFLSDAKIPNLLARAVDGDLTASGCAILRKIQGSKVGNFTIIFRVVKATVRDINREGGEGEEKILKDPFGREIYLLEGFVLQEMSDVIVTQEALEKAHQLLIKDYKQFWDWSEPCEAIPSQMFDLLEYQSSSSLKLEELQPFQANSKPPPLDSTPNAKYRFRSIAFLAIAATALVFGIWFVSTK